MIRGKIKLKIKFSKLTSILYGLNNLFLSSHHQVQKNNYGYNWANFHVDKRVLGKVEEER